MNLTDSRNYVQQWIIRNDVKISPNGRLEDKEGRTQIELQDRMLLDYEAEVSGYNRLMDRGSKIMPLKSSSLEMALREAIANHVLNARKTALSEITYNPSAIGRVNDFLEALQGQPPTDLEIKVLQHWMWSVKRKALGRSVIYHIMPIIFSIKQRNGKSKSLELLCSPLADYCMEDTVQSMSDSRNYFAYQNNLIAFVNEMQGTKRADMEAVKSIITQSTLDVRKLGTNLRVKISQNCSFFGTTNRHLSEILIDSEMRRFFQFNAAETIDRDKINSINYFDMWRSIDENLEYGYLSDVQEDLAKVQREYAQEDYHVEFMLAYDLQPVPKGSPYCFIRASDLYPVYVDWCATNGYKALSSNWLGIKLKSLKQLSIKLKDNDNKLNTYYRVNSKTKLPISIPKGFNKINDLKLGVL